MRQRMLVSFHRYSIGIKNSARQHARLDVELMKNIIVAAAAKTAIAASNDRYLLTPYEMLS